MNLDRIIAVRTDRAVYRDGEDCIKVFCRSYPSYEAFGEAFYRALAERAELPVPKVKSVTYIEGKPAIVSEYIKGKKLSCLLSEQPENRSQFLRLFVKLQRRILEADGIRLPRLSDKVKADLMRAELSSDRRNELYERLMSEPVENNFCHGDFCPSNVIVSENGTYVLDWHNAASGNAAADAAATYLHFLLRWNEGIADEYLDLFAPNGREEVLRWIPIIAAAQSVGGNVRDKERLLSVANAVE